MKIKELVSENTRKQFDRFNLSCNFLEINLELWQANADYLVAKNILLSFRVLNDCGERGVALITKFNSSLTTKKKTKAIFANRSEESPKRPP